MNDKNNMNNIQNKNKLNFAKSSFLKIINSLDNSEQIKQFSEFVEEFLSIKEIDEYELTLDITKNNNVNNFLILENIKKTFSITEEIVLFYI